MQLILASNNPGKISEITALLPGISLGTMREAGYTLPIVEPFDTFHRNALIKAQTVFDFCGLPVLADDSGLCTAALRGAPGVFSARYAGDGASDGDNNEKLLQELEAATDRRAWYIAVLCLITADGQHHYFEGRCDGRIADGPRGGGGFGYDPVFIPDGFDLTFGELPAEVKKRISHRAKALDALKRSGLPYKRQNST
jgi:XTP/dITP diphosphohydrolase